MRQENLIYQTSTQRVYKFPNGYGASVVKNEYSYGGQLGLWELAVLTFISDDKWILCYTTDITDDVIGYLDDKSVDELLEKIFNLCDEEQ